MFCPNCGTKNTETATTCTKCGFNIKGAAAPKFKGTMLMMNQQGAKPAVPPGPTAPEAPAAPAAAPAPAAPAPAAPLPAAEAKPKPVFKGTMVGVAPPGGFLAAPARAASGAPATAGAQPPVASGPGAPSTSPFGSPGPAAAPAAAPMGQPQPAPMGQPQPAPMGQPQPAPMGQPQPAAAPPGFGQAPPQFGGVNPLGGTVALPNAPAAYGLPVGGQFGAPPQQGAPYGAPPQQPGAPYGAPPQQPGAPYGAPQQQPGAPMGAQPGFPPPGGAPQQPPWAQPQQFGGPPPDATMPSQGASPAYGAPGQDPYGQQQGGYQQGYQQQGYQQQGYGAMVPGVGAPLAAPGTKGKTRNPIVCLVLAMFTCGVYPIIGPFLMLTELKTYLGKAEIVPWHLIIPVYNLYLLIVKVPEWVTEAKRRAGSRNPTSAGPLLYLLLGMYFLPKDLNEVWNPSA